jgi:hypothetical protein
MSTNHIGLLDALDTHEKCHTVWAPFTQPEGQCDCHTCSATTRNPFRLATPKHACITVYMLRGCAPSCWHQAATKLACWNLVLVMALGP